MVQVTETSDTAFSQACLDPAGRLFAFRGNSLMAVDLTTFATEELYRVPDGFSPALPTCTADGSHVAFAYRESLPVSTETGRIYSTMAERYYQHPRSVVMRVETASGEAQAWISSAHRPSIAAVHAPPRSRSPIIWHSSITATS
mgnify:CR=1 FL=1